MCKKTSLRWLGSVINNMGVGNWRGKSQYREEWRRVLEEAKVYKGP
jgi:hypothetical protein